MSKKLEAHEGLRDEISKVEKSALRLAAKGEKIQTTLTRLKECRREIEERIRFFRRAEGLRPSDGRAAPKPPQPPESKEEKQDPNPDGDTPPTAADFTAAV